MKIRHIILVLSLLMAIVAATPSQAQSRRDGGWAMGTIVDGDTLPHYLLRDIYVNASSKRLTAQEIRKNQKLIRNVKKMLPYARLAKSELDRLEQEASGLPEKERKALIKAREKEVLAQYTEELKNFTMSQGKVLLKLVDRETCRTSYVIVNELRGKLRAGFYQTFARLFGYNLKAHYDPRHDKEDNLIERIVLSIDYGQL